MNVEHSARARKEADMPGNHRLLGRVEPVADGTGVSKQQELATY
jgi:hypothetical protein